jgi:hypothetical protein
LANFVRILFGLAEIVYSAWKKGFFIVLEYQRIKSLCADE